MDQNHVSNFKQDTQTTTKSYPTKWGKLHGERKKKDTQSKNKNNNCIHLILVFIPPKLDLATINRHVIKVITTLYFYLLSVKHETSFRY